jgi:hypothetical protein
MPLCNTVSSTHTPGSLAWQTDLIEGGMYPQQSGKCLTCESTCGNFVLSGRCSWCQIVEMDGNAAKAETLLSWRQTTQDTPLSGRHTPAQHRLTHLDPPPLCLSLHAPSVAEVRHFPNVIVQKIATYLSPQTGVTETAFTVVPASAGHSLLQFHALLPLNLPQHDPRCRPIGPLHQFRFARSITSGRQQGSCWSPPYQCNLSSPLEVQPSPDQRALRVVCTFWRSATLASFIRQLATFLTAFHRQSAIHAIIAHQHPAVQHRNRMYDVVGSRLRLEWILNAYPFLGTILPPPDTPGV